MTLNCILLSLNSFEDRGNDSLSHSPDGSFGGVIGGEGPGNSGDFQGHAAIIRRILEPGEGNPERAGDFAIGNQAGAAGNGKYEGSGEDRWTSSGAGSNVVELAEQLAWVQHQPDLLPGFSNRGGEQVGISAGPPASRQSHVAGPWIAFPLRPTNDQHRIGLVSQHDRHCGFVDLGIPDNRRGPAGEPGLDKPVEGTQ